jgi:hypothetical protein
VGSRAGLDVCGKSRPTPGFDPRTAQTVASRYTDEPSWPWFPVAGRVEVTVDHHPTIHDNFLCDVGLGAVINE